VGTRVSQSRILSQPQSTPRPPLPSTERLAAGRDDLVDATFPAADATGCGSGTAP
jgi:hypothetical protein